MMGFKSRRAFAASLLASVASAAMFSGVAVAQDQCATGQQLIDGKCVAAPQEIVVTGSRIQKPDYQFTNPVVSVDAKSIEYSGVTNVTQLMERIPALVNSFDSTASAGAALPGIGATGLNLLNLRNLGVDRTLVLVNGRRHVSGDVGSAAVDTNSIPVDLIANIEIETGGASAIYGADGVSGVVNFIMKDNFEGWRLRTQGGTTSDGGGGNEFVSLTGGLNLDDDKANIAANVEFSHDGRVTSSQRSYAANETRFVRPPAGSPYVGVYDRIPMNDLRWYGSGPGGAIDVDGDFEPDFNGTGGAWDFGTVPTPGINGETYQQGGDGTPTSGYGRDLEPDIQRINASVFGHYDITDHLRVFTELEYVHTLSLSYSQPSFDYFLAIPSDNYYLTHDLPGVAAAAAGNGFSGFGSPGVDDGSVLVTRDNFDLGVRGERIDRDMLRGVFGFKGDAGGWGHWEVSYLDNEMLQDNLQLNNRYNDRFAAALDAVDDGHGNPVCRSDLNPAAVPPNVDWQGWAPPTSFTPGPGSGCQPIDIFGVGSPSAAAVNWIMTELARQVETQATRRPSLHEWHFRSVVQVAGWIGRLLIWRRVAQRDEFEHSGHRRSNGADVQQRADAHLRRL